MKRAYEVKVERGNNWLAASYVVIASSDEEAVRKAKRQAQRDNGIQTGWRCVSLAERDTQVIG